MPATYAEAASGTDSVSVGTAKVTEAPSVRTPGRRDSVAPMLPRLSDPRVSYLTTPAPGGEGQYIQRWRIEKRNSGAAPSEVIRPIVFRIDSSVPKRWVPWVRRGVEAWIPAFDAIGFQHALVVRGDSGRSENAGSPASGPDHEVLIRWAPDSDVMEGEGAHADDYDIDPHSGEIRHVTITYRSALIERGAAEAFIATAAVDPRVHYPYPDSLLGALIQMLAEHEVGHSLGLNHRYNMRATYPNDSVHRADFVHRMGYTSSVMGYVFFHYTAQPGDHIAPEELHMRVGPYDRWSLAWGYRPIPGVQRPEDEVPTLTRWLAAQDTAPYLKGSRDDEEMNVIGDDLLAAATDAVRNIVQVAEVLDAVPASGAVGGSTLDPIDTARYDLHRRMIMARWAERIRSALYVFRSVVPEDSETTQGAATPLPPPSIDSAHQVQAFRFVISHVFYGQDDFIRRSVRPRTVPAAMDPKDTTAVVLFDTIAPIWSGRTKAWQDLQYQMMLAIQRWVGVVQDAAPKSARARALLPALRQELQALDRRLAQLPESSPEITEHKGALRGVLEELLSQEAADGTP